MRAFLLRGLFVTIVSVFLTQNAFAAAEVKQASAPVAAVSQSNVSSSSSKDETAPTTKTETLKITAVSQPFQVAIVDGDYHKYEAMNWQNRGYSGGVNDLLIQCASGDDVTMDASGSGIIGNGDYKGAYSIKKKDVGYMDFDFNQFRKYYDTYGGIFQGQSNSLSRDLFLDIGHIGFETGITMPDLPSVSVYYDHDYKIGSKSMLNWDTAMIQGSGKKISPSWEEINETTDTFGIKGDYTENGYHLIGDQRWDISRWKTRGYEQRLNNGSYVSTLTGSTPANTILVRAADVSNQSDQRRQDQVQETQVMTTTLGVDKWYWEDKVFASSAYRFQHLKNQDRQNIQEFNKNGQLSLGTISTNSTTGISTLTATTASLNKPDGSAHNEQDLNSWVMNLMVSPWSCLSGTSGFKAEITQRDASSYYPNDTTNAAQGVIDNTGKTNTESNTYKFAESFGLRFKAIPRTVLYTDLSFEQSTNHLIVNRKGIPGAAAATASDNQTRDGIINEPVINWVAGADFQPFRRINLTSQFRAQDKDMQFHDRYRLTPFEGQVFLKKLHTTDLGFTQRATAHLCSWSQTSFRYLFDNTDYISRAITQTGGGDSNEKAKMLSNTFIYDLTVYPRSNLSMTGSFTQRYDQTKTVQATSMPTAQLVPAFTSNFSTWMFSTDYQPHVKVHLDGSLFYTTANNSSDFTSYQQQDKLIYYGANYNQLGLTVGCKWDLNKDLSVTPQYGFQRYMPGRNSGIGGAYDAQILSLGITSTWG